MFHAPLKKRRSFTRIISIIPLNSLLVYPFIFHCTEINFVGAVTRGKPFSGGKRVIPRTPFLKPLILRKVYYQINRT